MSLEEKNKKDVDIDEQFDIFFKDREDYKKLNRKEKAKIQKKILHGWNVDKQKTVTKWIDNLEYIQLIVYFHMFYLKKIENSWAWVIIVLSALSSTASLTQFSEGSDNLKLGINITLSIFTLLTTLIASWTKKQNYVQRIAALEKYLQSLNILISELQGQTQINPEDRIPWNEFLDRYRDKVVEFDSSMPLIAPEDWKETVYVLTKFYPELTKDTFPWKDDPSWRKNILNTYRKVKYRGCFKQMCSLYWCKTLCISNYHSQGSENNADLEANILNVDPVNNIKKDFELKYDKNENKLYI